jgi:hypothetical protein
MVFTDGKSITGLDRTLLNKLQNDDNTAPVLLYILLRRYRVSLLISSLSAFFLLITSANFSVWPKVNHFELMVLLVFLALAAIPKQSALSFAILALGCLLAAYVRPEMFFSFALCFAISLGLFIFRERSLLNAAALASLALFAIAGSMYVGYPLSGTRGWGAFSQHFSLNWVAWTGNTALSPWSDAQQIVQMNFGPVSSIGQAALRNPAAFAHHVLQNAINFPKALVSTFTIHPSFFAAFHIRSIKAAYILLALGIGGFVFSARKTILPHLRLAMRTEKRFLFSVGVVSSVIILSSLIIYPRPHYIFVLGTLLLAVLAILLDPFRDRQMSWSHRVVTALCAALLILVATPNLANSSGTALQPKPTLEAIQFIQTLDITSEVRLLSQEFGYTTYLADNWGQPSCTLDACGNWKAVPSYTKTAWDPNDPGKSVPFDSFRRDEKINMILVTDDLLNDERFRDNAEWRVFLEHPERVGFVKLVLPDGKRALYVDKTILRSAK